MKDLILSLPPVLFLLKMVHITSACWKSCSENCQNHFLLRSWLCILQCCTLKRTYYSNYSMFAGVEENFQVCANEYTSWGCCRGWSSLLCMCALKSRRGCCPSCWTNALISYIIYERDASNRLCQWDFCFLFCKQGFYSIFSKKKI